ncbi:hypothetical protein CEXT_182941 [Caerostris extrusa]|uniref:Uncharacterized protein n=1 Tax=Caerostris extrusa TaxID=172846 RepID=A0AAV4RVL3_CAEEX|nr:hypothetical protein CEXT_182941 [Caerostris extrusa]
MKDCPKQSVQHLCNTPGYFSGTNGQKIRNCLHLFLRIHNRAGAGYVYERLPHQPKGLFVNIGFPLADQVVIRSTCFESRLCQSALTKGGKVILRFLFFLDLRIGEALGFWALLTFTHGRKKRYGHRMLLSAALKKNHPFRKNVTTLSCILPRKMSMIILTCYLPGIDCASRGQGRSG